MAYMNVNVNVSAMQSIFASATKVRVRSLPNGQVQVRPTDRVSDKNLPEGEQLRNISAKGNSGRFGLPSVFTAFWPKEGTTKIGFQAAKHGWYTVVPAALTEGRVDGSFSAK